MNTNVEKVSEPEFTWVISIEGKVLRSSSFKLFLSCMMDLQSCSLIASADDYWIERTVQRVYCTVEKIVEVIAVD